MIHAGAGSAAAKNYLELPDSADNAWAPPALRPLLALAGSGAGALEDRFDADAAGQGSQLPDGDGTKLLLGHRRAVVWRNGA